MSIARLDIVSDDKNDNFAARLGRRFVNAYFHNFGIIYLQRAANTIKRMFHRRDDIVQIPPATVGWTHISNKAV